jgi:anti-anti-sigma factor
MGKAGTVLDIALNHSADGVVLSLHGDVDATTGPVLEREFARTLALVGEGRLIVDMAGVGSLDACGIRALTGVARRAERHGVCVVVRNFRRTDPRVFDVVELATMLAIEVAPRPSPSPGRASWERSPWDPPDWATSSATWPS